MTDFQVQESEPDGMPDPSTWRAYVQHVEAEIDRLRTELEMIADDERPWHTCEHSDRAREALDG